MKSLILFLLILSGYTVFGSSCHLTNSYPDSSEVVRDDIISDLEMRRKYFAELYKVYDAQLPISYIGTEFHSSNVPTSSDYWFPYVFTARPVFDIKIVKPTFNPKWFKPTVGVLFMPEIRMIRAYSNPVRTPSYHIGIYSRMTLTNPSEKPKKYKFVEATLIHHSNGQDGEWLQNGQINLISGSFSTNYTDISYGSMENIGRTTSGKVFLLQKYGVQIHHTIPGGFDGGVLENYGLFRAKGSVSLIFNGLSEATVDPKDIIAQYEWLRITLDVMFNVGKIQYDNSNPWKRLNAELTIKGTGSILGSYISPFCTTGWTGQDQYNIFYMNEYFFIRAGNCTDVNRLFTLRNPQFATAYPFQ